jgi:hypothetical protein
MKSKIFLLLAVATAMFVASCEKDDAWKDHQDFAPNKDVAGEYWVQYWVNGTPQADPSVLLIYNTASDASKIWVDDQGNFWDYKVKTNVGGTNFSVNKGIDIQHDDTTTITNGRVFGDSISLELEWVSDPGTIYVCKGKRRTGFEK